MKKGFITIPIAIILSLFAVGVGIYTEVSKRQIVTEENQVDTSGWKTYRNDVYGFEISYPEDFEVKNVDENIHLIIPIDKYFRTQLANEARIELRVPKKSCPEDLPLGDSHSDDQGVVIAGNIEFTKHRWSDIGAGQFYTGNTYRTNYEGECYEIVLFTHSAGSAGFFIDDQDEIKRLDALHAEDMTSIFKLADKIVSTFKFTEKTSIDTSDWKTYRNEKYGFEFKYPPDSRPGNEGCGYDYCLNDDGFTIDVTNTENFLTLFTIRDEPAVMRYLGNSGSSEKYSLTLEDFANYIWSEEKDRGNLLYENELLQKIVLDGETAYSFGMVNEHNLKTYKVVVAEMGGTRFQFTTPFNSLDGQKIIDSIKSIEKIRVDDVSVWKTYENKNHGIRFKYPYLEVTEKAGGFDSDVRLLIRFGRGLWAYVIKNPSSSVSDLLDEYSRGTVTIVPESHFVQFIPPYQYSVFKNQHIKEVYAPIPNRYFLAELKNNNDRYVIIGGAFYTQEYENVFKLFLDTIEFIDSE